MLRRPWRLAMAQTARQKCTKLQQPTSWRACRKKRLPNGGNFPILGIGSFLHTPALRPGRFFTVMEGKTLHFGNPQATPAEKPLQFELGTPRRADIGPVNGPSTDGAAPSRCEVFSPAANREPEP